MATDSIRRTPRQTSGHELFHFAHSLLEADHQRAGHDAVADIEFRDAFQGGDRLDVAIGQAVAGV